MGSKTRIQYTECFKGHRMKLEIAEDTPNLIQVLKCPTCGDKRVGLVGELISVTSTDEECPEKNLLLDTYSKKVGQYKRAVLEMKDKVLDIPREEWNVLWAAAEHARVACESARDGLKKHAEEHGC